MRLIWGGGVVPSARLCLNTCPNHCSPGACLPPRRLLQRRCFADVPLPGWNRPHSPSIDGSPTNTDAVCARYLYLALRDAEGGRTYEAVTKIIESLRFSGQEVSVLTYNSALRILSIEWSDRPVWRLFNEMKGHGVHPDRDTYCIVLTVLGRAGWHSAVKSLTREMKTRGFGILTCPSTVKALIASTDSPEARWSLYRQCKGRMASADRAAVLDGFVDSSQSYPEGLRFLKEVPGAPETLTARHYTTLMRLVFSTGRASPSPGGPSGSSAGCVVAQSTEEIFALIGQAGLGHDVPVHNALLRAMQPSGDSRRAAEIFKAMCQAKLQPTERTYVSFSGVVLSDPGLALCDKVSVCEALWFAAIPTADTLRVHTSLMRCYAAAGGRQKDQAMRLRHHIASKGLKFTQILQGLHKRAVGNRSVLDTSDVLKVSPVRGVSLREALRICLRQKQGGVGGGSSKGSKGSISKVPGTGGSEVASQQGEAGAPRTRGKSRTVAKPSAG